MNTPICDFVKKYAESNSVRAHMPGHKGMGEAERYDITEIDGADVLYSGEGVIFESQKNASLLFGSRKTLYSTEGSSLSIRAMLYLTRLYASSKGEKCRILALRNAHKAFITASAILGIDVDFIFPEENEGLTVCKVSAERLEKELSELSYKPAALYITSPDYLGNVADIKALSAVCKKEGILLLVDNAHGAYLKLLPESQHPLDFGADIVCDSAHKTLPVLTGGGYLHIGKNAPDVICDNAEKAMMLFASTSPSYLILQSIDKANVYLSQCRDELTDFCKKVEELKKELSEKGFALTGDEPLKLTVCTKQYGYTGEDFAEYLLKEGIVCEFYDPDYVCLMLTPQNSNEDIKRIKEAFLKAEKKNSINTLPPVIIKPQKHCSPKDALFSLSERLPIDECECRVLSAVTVSCPPAVPVIVSGEVIDENALEVMRYYGVTHIEVLRANEKLEIRN